MELLMLCPANVATGGTESIHRACNEFNKQEGIEAKIFYRRCTDKCPQPEEYEEYKCDYVTKLPEGFTGAVVFPEIWADMCVEHEYDKCVKAINWAGVDVYEWNTRPNERYKFLSDKNAIHLAHSAYAINFLRQLRIENDRIFRFSGNLNNSFYVSYQEVERSNTVLYNPVKRTDFDYAVMKEARSRGIKFKAIENMTRYEVIDLMRRSKLYIDFGKFSGRERIPREAVMCGCCVLTSRSGAAQYYADVPIDDKYKFPASNTYIIEAVDMMESILSNYAMHRPAFNYYRESLSQDVENFKTECKVVAEEMIRRYNEI